ISMKELQSKLSSHMEEIDEFILDNASIEKDLSKIEFTPENVAIKEEDSFANYPCGYKTLSNNLPVLFVNDGGDWEFPICFIIYWDGSKLRGYIPNKGNNYDRKNKAAYGNYDCEEYDDEKEMVPDHEAIF